MDPAGDATLERIYEQVAREAGGVPRLYQALAAAPPLLQGWIDFAWALRADAKAPRGLRELAILRCAQLGGSDYVWRSHVRLATSAGVTDEQLDALASGDPGVFSSLERAVLRIVDELVGGVVADATWQALSAELGEEMMVEMVLTISWYAHVTRVVSALGVPLEAHHGKVARVPGIPPRGD
ncbi:carboxymuconolactone decarboxylase family protein [Nocardioides massiliensis]|uniref:AhpD family alkylhydroperoxidase n=1 Tax=Nocardioides massiliensis TaxID=1325935 RepID=A0ABT9NK22_9ACTN|nr:carboxymuconolactone decarboxylase family protein [Nocardioides massiliensis]MDP9820764.1 AhpD family alkylhydroperoxidase [Nocardioides massiliensis]